MGLSFGTPHTLLSRRLLFSAVSAGSEVGLVIKEEGKADQESRYRIFCIPQVGPQ